jgi:hypothetical protein
VIGSLKDAHKLFVQKAGRFDSVDETSIQYAFKHFSNNLFVLEKAIEACHPRMKGIEPTLPSRDSGPDKMAKTIQATGLSSDWCDLPSHQSQGGPRIRPSIEDELSGLVGYQGDESAF